MWLLDFKLDFFNDVDKNGDDKKGEATSFPINFHMVLSFNLLVPRVQKIIRKIALTDFYWLNL